MSNDRPHALGRAGERLAEGHLQSLGFRTLDRNVRTRGGEIDLIAYDGRTLVFVEVKSRLLRDPHGPLRAETDPLGRLGSRQRARLRVLAAAWLRDRAGKRPSAEQIRFDAIGVLLDTNGAARRIDHLANAW